MLNDIDERYELIRERIIEIKAEKSAEDKLCDFFAKASEYIYDSILIYEAKKKGTLEIEALKKMNERIGVILGEKGYENSYLNPAFSVKELGDEGRYLSFLYSEIMNFYAYALCLGIEDIVILSELFIQIYGILQDKEAEEKQLLKSVKEAIYYHYFDYSDYYVGKRMRETLDPAESFAKDIVLNSDLTNTDYLYNYGEYISENEIKTSEFLNSMSEEEIEGLASTYTEGFKNGFVAMGIDMSKKKNVCIRYFIGQERIVRCAIKQFEAMGLDSILARYPLSRISRRMVARPGYTATPANRQFDFDHRMDDAIFLDAAFVERKLEVIEKAYEDMKELASVYAGPAVIECFGESEFFPEDKKEAWHYTDKQKKLSVSFMSQNGKITNRYIPGDEYSFTIIAFPMPEIGDDFEEIFRETVKVNTLSNDKYRRIQQAIIDTLDTADYAVIEGSNGNMTNLKVNLWKLKDAEKETIFENCVADVNIPVGEVFTSPVLSGTEGTLNVSHVYLNGLPFKKLILEIKDGKITDYSCQNFEDEEKNKAYIRDNILFNHETLPMGEFAIGTNTTAYMMAKKFDIEAKLPILIMEKTGPHFAFGDTCYSHSEDHKVYNPDGKEIVARENECSALRDEKPEEAYFNCHTDITIPYEELGAIYAVRKDGEKILIIKDGRFVLPGTEELNEVLS